MYEDTGEVRIGKYTIRNSDKESHGLQSMTQVLEKSLNTGIIYAVSESQDSRLARVVSGRHALAGVPGGYRTHVDDDA